MANSKIQGVEPVSVDVPEGIDEPDLSAGDGEPGQEHVGMDEAFGPEVHDHDPTLMTLEEFRRWYAGRFALINSVMAPFIGGRLDALRVDASDSDLREASDALWHEAMARGWVRLLRKPRGIVNMVETQGGFLGGIAIAAAGEFRARLEAAQAAQDHAGNAGAGGAAAGPATENLKPGEWYPVDPKTGRRAM